MRPPLLQRLWLRLAAVCAVAAVVPVLVAGLWTAAQLEADALRSARQRLQSTAELGAGIAQRYVERGLAKLQNLARLLGERGERGDAARAAELDEPVQAIAAQLDRQVEPADLFLEVQFYDDSPTQQVVAQRQTREVQLAQSAATTDPLAPLLELAGTEVARAPILTGRPAVARASLSRFGFPMAPIGVPVGTTAGGDGLAANAPRGALVGVLDLRGLAAELAPLAGDGALAIVGDDGAPMARVGAAPAADAVTAARDVADFGWRAVASMAPDTALAAAAAARRRAWTWTIAAALLAVAMALGAAAWIGRPIGAVTRAARAMATGDLSARVRLSRRDEIGALGRAFDEMAAALQQLDRARSDFVATVSHELRTPLTSLRMSLDNLADGLLGELNDDQRAALDRVKADVDRLKDLVAGMLQLARLEAGAEAMQPQACDLAAVAAAACGSRRDAAARRGVALEVRGEGRCRGDAALLQRVVENLVDNAVRFSPEGGAVTIEVGPGRLSVRDRGPGFAVARPFEPFVRDEATGSARGGTGLGLAIVQRIVHLHGGAVAARSEDGGVVTLELPEAS